MLPDFLLPYHAVDSRNPIFRHLRIHVRWLDTPTRFHRYTQLTLLGLPLLLLLGWLLEHVNLHLTPSGTANRLVDVTFEAAIIVMVLTSLYSLPRLLGRFSAQFNSAYWDSLRLTPLYNSAILMAHDAVAQLRLWPLTAIEISLRTTTIILFALNNIYDTARIYPQPSDFVAHMLLNPTYFGVWGVVLCMGIAFCIEPVIRARFIVALHLAIAARVSSLPLALLTGFAAIVIIHTLQGIVVILLYALYQALYIGGIGILFCFLPASIFTTVALWSLIRRLRAAALGIAYNTAFHQD